MAQRGRGGGGRDYFTESSRAHSEWVEVSEARRPWSIFFDCGKSERSPKVQQGTIGTRSKAHWPSVSTGRTTRPI